MDKEKIEQLKAQVKAFFIQAPEIREVIELYKKNPNEARMITDIMKEAAKEQAKQMIDQHPNAEVGAKLFGEVLDYIIEKATEDKLPEPEEIPDVKTKRVMKALMPVSKVAKFLFDNEHKFVLYDDESPVVERIALFVGEDKKDEAVKTYLSVNVEELLDKVQTRDDVILDHSNKAVHDAIGSLWAAGNEYFTLDRVFRVRNGITDTSKRPSKEQREAIEFSITKLGNTSIKIDATEEVQKYGAQQAFYEGKLLFIESVTAKINGNECTCYHLLREPVLFNYARAKKQIADCDLKILAVPVSLTEENLKIRDYLFQAISHMKSKRNKKAKHTCRFNTLFTYLKVEAPTEASLETKQRRIRDTVFKILKYWRDQGFIESYITEKGGERGNKIEKFTVITGSENPKKKKALLNKHQQGNA